MPTGNIKARSGRKLVRNDLFIQLIERSILDTTTKHEKMCSQKCHGIYISSKRRRKMFLPGNNGKNL